MLERRCPQCGFDAPATDPGDTPARIRANAAGWRAALSRGDVVRRRPPVPPGQPPVWSAIEYGAHVRDVYELSVERLTRMLRKKAPTFPNWDQDHAAITGNYAEADANKVSYDLAYNAGRMADLLDRVTRDQWQRTGTRSDGAQFTVASYARYILHDAAHHLWDVEQGYEAIAEADRPPEGEAGELDEHADEQHADQQENDDE